MAMELAAAWDTKSALWSEEAFVAESAAVLVQGSDVVSGAQLALAMDEALREVMVQPWGVLSVAA